MADLIRIAKGQDVIQEFTIIAYWAVGEPIAVKLSAASAPVVGSATLSVERLKYALTAGDMLIFEDNLVVTVDTGGAAIGTSSIPVTGIGGVLLRGDVGKKLQNLDDNGIYALVLKLAVSAKDTVALLSYTCTNQPQSTTTGRGRTQATFLRADTLALASGMYAGNVWRTNSGSQRPMGPGYDVEIFDAGNQ